MKLLGMFLVYLTISQVSISLCSLNDLASARRRKYKKSTNLTKSSADPPEWKNIMSALFWGFVKGATELSYHTEIDKCLPNEWKDLSGEKETPSAESQNVSLVLDIISKVINFVCAFKTELKTFFKKKLNLGDKLLYLQRMTRLKRKIIGDIVGGIGKATDAVVSGVGKAVDTVKGAADSVKNEVGKTTDKVTSEIGKTVDAVGKTVKSVTSEVGKAADRVTSEVGKTADKVTSEVGKVTDKVASEVGKTVDKVTSEVGKTVDKVTSEVGKTVDKVANQVADVVNWVKDIAAKCQEHVTKLAQDGFDKISDWKKAGAEKYEQFKEKVNDVIKNVLETITNVLDKYIKKHPFFKGLVETVFPCIVKTFDQNKTVAILLKFKEMAEGLKSKITALASNLWMGLAKVFIELICKFDTFRKAADNLVKGLNENTNLPKKYGYFGEFLGGLANGISTRKARKLQYFLMKN